MVKLHEKGTHCWEENTSVNICKKKIILKSREKKKKKKVNTKVGLQNKNLSILGFLFPGGLIIDM